MKNEMELKEIVKEKYGKIALKNNQSSSCCSSDCCSTSTNNNVMAENYNELNGYNSDADLGLGCGLPTKFALIKRKLHNYTNFEDIIGNFSLEVFCQRSK